MPNAGDVTDAVIKKLIRPQIRKDGMCFQRLGEAHPKVVRRSHEIVIRKNMMSCVAFQAAPFANVEQRSVPDITCSIHSVNQ